MSIRELFKSKIAKNNSNAKPHKFNVGDVILNKKFGKLYRIVSVSEDRFYDQMLYCMANMKSTNEWFHMHRCTEQIDPWYIKVDAKAAKILYGKNK